jgi:hypothetical protein
MVLSVGVRWGPLLTAVHGTLVAGMVQGPGCGWRTAGCIARGGATGVELERHVTRLDRYQAAVADVDPAWSAGVWWFTP